MPTGPELYGADFVCEECGRRHHVNVRSVYVGPDVAGRLPQALRQHAGVSDGAVLGLIADTRTHAVAGAAAVDSLTRAGFAVTPVIVPDGDGGKAPVCDDHTRAWIENRLPDAAAFIAVGSGVMNDMTKWIAGDRGVPYVVIGTAASMNGYASDNIAPTIRGVKSLLYGTAPVAILTDPAVLAAAPAAMTASGLGDVLAKSVSTADWRVNQVLFDEYYCPLCAGLIDEIEPRYTECPGAIGQGTDDGIRALFDALILTGVAMSMAGTSSPASGGEHLISHTLDMMSMLDGTPHDLHGRQVGIGTLIGAALYERLLDLEAPEFCVPPQAETDPGFWRRFSDAVEEEHSGKRVKAARAARILAADPFLWDAVREAIRPVYRPPARTRDILKRAGAACTLDDIGVSRERFLAAFLHAHEMRERFTVLDLARCAGLLPDAAEAIVDEWVMS